MVAPGIGNGRAFGSGLRFFSSAGSAFWDQYPGLTPRLGSEGQAHALRDRA